MQRYFLTVSDKNPIMFNDMLCEYVESRLVHNSMGGLWWVCVCVWGGHLQKSAYPLDGAFEHPRCTCTCTRFHMGALT